MKKRLVLFGPVEGDHLNRWLPPFVGEYDIHVITLHADPQAIPGVRYSSLPRPTGTRLDFLLTIPALRRWLREVKPDLFHVHYLSSYGIAASFSGLKCPRVLSVWGSDVNNGLKSFWLGALCRRALRWFDAINSPSHHLAKKMMAVGIPASKIHVFQYGVKTENLRQRKIVPSQSHFHLLSMRDWAPLYRIEKIIELFSSYALKHKDVDLHLMGRATPPQKEVIESLLRASPVKDRIHNHGFLPYDEMLEKISAMDIMISIPTMDGMPLSLQESNYVGHWPILSRIPANEEWAGEDGASYLDPLDDQNFEQVMETAKKLCRSEEKIRRLQEKTLKEGDFKTNLRRLGTIYKEILQKS